jgi:endonuclease-3
MRRFWVLTGLILSAQTKDEVTAATVRALDVYFRSDGGNNGDGSGLTAVNVAGASEEEIGIIIGSVGFWRKKSGFLRDAALACVDNHGGDIPRETGCKVLTCTFTRTCMHTLTHSHAFLTSHYISGGLDELMALRGVGPKMAHLCLTHAWGETQGIGVDLHVHRIAQRLMW